MDISNVTIEDVLQNNSSSSILGLEGIAELYEHMKLEKLLSQCCDLEKIKYREEINQYYIVINRKQFTANSRDALLLKLYDHFFGAQNRTLAENYREWMLWRKEIKTKGFEKSKASSINSLALFTFGHNVFLLVIFSPLFIY